MTAMARKGHQEGGIILTESDLNLNFKATFCEAVTPFTIDVDGGFLATTKLKASMTRFVDDIDQPEYTDGPPKHYVERIARFWSDEYDWRSIEAGINRGFKQYTTIISIGNPDFPHLVPLHFVHHPSTRTNAIPLLFIHGWPGSFLEVDNLLEPLTNPLNDELPAFHVIAPSIPGFGFSPSPRRPGMGYRKTAAAFHALMQKLGYPKFVYQGGDAGDFIGHLMAIDYPDAVISGHSNFWIVPPTPADLERFSAGQTTEDEKFVIERLGSFADSHWSYAQIHQTRPLKLAIGLTDSPVGLAMWIYDICRTVVEDPDIFTPEKIVTWTMMHWINGPYTAFSLYKNGRKVSLPMHT